MVADCDQKGIKFPSVVKGFQLLEGSNVTEIEKKMIVSAVKYDGNEVGLYKDMASSLKKNGGEAKSLGRVTMDKLSREEVEALVAENAEVFKAAGFAKGGGSRRRSLSENDGSNPIGRDGKQMKSYHCQSSSHLRPDCEKYSKYKANKDSKKKDEYTNTVKEKEKKVEKKPAIALYSKKNDSDSNKSFFSEVFSVSAEDTEYEVVDVMEHEAAATMKK